MQSLSEQIDNKINQKTKPLGALGKLEKWAKKIALIQNTLELRLTNPHIVIFAGDHGVSEERVSAYPSEVTTQMVHNFLAGGAAINVFCRQQNIELKIVDAGTKGDFSNVNQANFIQAKIAKGTKNFAKEAAMNPQQMEEALRRGKEIVDEVYQQGCNVIGFGEMGIGNTSSASVLMHLLTALPLTTCVGRGTGLDDAQLLRKIYVLEKATLDFESNNIKEILAHFGGFEIAMMVGAILAASQLKMIVLIDGFISSAAYLVAQEMYSNIKNNCFFSHLSEESGHFYLLEHLDIEPMLHLDLRLGEGTGCALAYPLLQNAVIFFNEMASFESAGVSQKST